MVVEVVEAPESVWVALPKEVDVGLYFEMLRLLFSEQEHQIHECICEYQLVNGGWIWKDHALDSQYETTVWWSVWAVVRTLCFSSKDRKLIFLKLKCIY